MSDETDPPESGAPRRSLDPERVERREGALSGRPAGAGVRYHTWTAGAPRRTLIVVHGQGEHSKRYDEFARAMVVRGWRVVAPDLRGFGVSEGPRGHVDAWTDYVDDVADTIAQLVPSGHRPPAIVAHSMGGLVALDLVQQRPEIARALIATSPLLGVAVEVPAYKRILGIGLSRLHGRFSLPTSIDNRLLTRDEGKLAEIEEDPRMVYRASARWFTEMTAAIERVKAGAPAMSTPTLVVHGDDDGVTVFEESRRLVEAMPEGVGTFLPWPDGRHELLNEPFRESVYEAYADWLEER